MWLVEERNVAFWLVDESVQIPFAYWLGCRGVLGFRAVYKVRWIFTFGRARLSWSCQQWVKSLCSANIHSSYWCINSQDCTKREMLSIRVDIIWVIINRLSRHTRIYSSFFFSLFLVFYYLFCSILFLNNQYNEIHSQLGKNNLHNLWRNGYFRNYWHLLNGCN